MVIEYIFQIDDKLYRITGHNHTSIKVAIHEFASEISGKRLKPANIISVDGRPSGRIVYLPSKEARDQITDGDYNTYVHAFQPQIKESYLSIVAHVESQSA